MRSAAEVGEGAARRLGGRTVGVWNVGLRRQPVRAATEAVVRLDELGFDAVWIPGSSGGDVFDRAEALLRASKHLVVATGVVNIWMHEVGQAASRSCELMATSGQRFLLGLGCSHAPLVARAGFTYRAPIAKMEQFLDELDVDGRIGAGQRVLAALGPKMLRLAALRAAGAHPFNVTPLHTEVARAALGPDAFLAPEVKVMPQTEPSVARQHARAQLAPHLQLPNYVTNLLRLGFDDDDIAGGGSDRLIDALVAWGDEDVVLRRIHEHFDAGADHVCLNVVTEDVAELPLDEWRRLGAMVASEKWR